MKASDLAADWDDVIEDAQQAGDFIADCVRALGGGFRPDSRFGDYGTAASDAMFTEADAATLDARMVEAVATGIDIHAVTRAALQARFVCAECGGRMTQEFMEVYKCANGHFESFPYQNGDIEEEDGS